MTTVQLTSGFEERDRAVIVRLLRAYEAGIGISLGFQSFDDELAALPGDYAPPGGAFIVARAERSDPVGVVALRMIDAKLAIGEMKRLYVDPAARGQALGRRLAQAAVEEARRLGVRLLRLDTLPQMVGAQALYEGLGFRDIANYNGNPIAGARFMELRLDKEAP